AAAELIRNEPLSIKGNEVPCHVVTVTYEPSPHRGVVVRGSPFFFWVAAETHLVLRSEFEMTVEFPRHGLRTSKHILTVTHIAIDQPIDPSTFEFTPPPRAEEISRGAGWIGGGGGCSRLRQIGEGEPGMSHSNSHHWEGATFV